MNKLYLMTFLVFTTVFSRINAQPTQWSSLGIGGGGAFSSPSINPNNPNEIFVASERSSVFHTTNLGDSWNTLDFRTLQSGIFTGKIQYTNDPNTLYSLNNLYDFFSIPTKSTNGGVTWEPLQFDPTDGEAYSLYVDYNNPEFILISDYTAIYASTNGGQTFALKYGGINSPPCHIAGVFFDGSVIYIGTNLGLILSQNGGSSFSLIPYGGIQAGEAMVSFAGAKQGTTTRLFCTTLNDLSVYPGVTSADYASFTGLYTLDIGQAGWVYKISGISAADYPFYIATAPNNINVAYLAGGNETGTPIVYKTTTAGASWSKIFFTTNNTNISTGWQGFSGDKDWSFSGYSTGLDVNRSDATKVTITDLNGIYFSLNGGTAWRQGYVKSTSQNNAGTATPLKKNYKGVGLENTKCWNLAWADSLKIIAGLSELGAITSTDAGTSWAFNGLGAFSTVYYTLKHLKSSIVYSAVSNVNDIYEPSVLTDDKIEQLNGQVLSSTDAGKTWTLLHDFQRPVIWLAEDPNNPNRLYASVVSSGFGGIYMSNDINKGSSSTWTRLSAPPRTQGHPLSIQVLKDGSLVCSYSARRSGTPLIFTKSSGVFYSTDNGATWSDRTDVNMQFWTKDVVVDPQDATQNTWYACVYSGYGADGSKSGTGGLYRTRDRGVTWKKIAGLDRVSSCTVNSLVPDEMYVTTESDGLWFTSNLSNETPVFTQVFDYPYRQPQRVFFNPYKPYEIWVTSYGNGIYSAIGAQPVAPSSPILLSPSNDSTNVPTTKFVFWNGAAVATNYHVQISLQADFSTTVKDTVVPTPYCKYIGLNETTTYYWRVSASNSVGTSAWSDIWKFTTIKNPQKPEMPMLLSPAKDTIGVLQTRNVVWNLVSGAETYRVQLSKDSTFASTIVDQAGIIGNSSTYSGLAQNTRYFWRVNATNTVGTSPWSEVWGFTTRSLEAVEEGALTGMWLECSPNPTSKEVSISFSLIKSGNIKLSFVTLLGVEAKLLLNEWKSVGEYKFNSDIQLPQGTYFIKLQTESGVFTRELHIIR
ncbi:MAG: T9SS type A sorting domain-containing protein [Bacteroidetes bacterium]|nr:T9SS type A sorting domain-containing protein [Bacteroidota bacterium]